MSGLFRAAFAASQNRDKKEDKDMPLTPDAGPPPEGLQQPPAQEQGLSQEEADQIRSGGLFTKALERFQGEKSREHLGPVGGSQSQTLDSFLLPHLKESEGFREEAYYATEKEKEEGTVTIGYGQTGVANIGDTVTQEEAEKMLQDSLAKFKATLKKEVKGYDDLSMRTKAAITDLAFNGGAEAVGPKARAAIEAGDEEEALLQTLDTANQGGKTMLGLAKRRAKAYNWASQNKIVEVEQTDSGRIIYRGADGSEVFSYRKPRSPDSEPGVVKID